MIVYVIVVRETNEYINVYSDFKIIPTKYVENPLYYKIIPKKFYVDEK